MDRRDMEFHRLNQIAEEGLAKVCEIDRVICVDFGIDDGPLRAPLRAKFIWNGQQIVLVEQSLWSESGELERWFQRYAEAWFAEQDAETQKRLERK